MDLNTVAVTDLVKSLGYKGHSKLSNKICNILKEKEDFKTRFIIDDRDDKYGRVEKVTVLKSAETLVDNLAILSQFTYLFGKGEGKNHAAYKELLKGVDEKAFNLKVQNKRRSLKEEVKRTNSSLKDLPVFANAILHSKSFDITKQSIRELMQAQIGNDELIDFQDTLELSDWNEVIELKDKIEMEGDNSTLYQRIGEKFFELGDIEQALISLDKSIEIDPQNGISWAIKSLIFYKILKANKQSHFQALALTEFSGEISNPITSEEMWINERVDDTYSELSRVKEQFVMSAIKALTYWPAWEGVSGYVEGKPNYFYKLNMAHESDVELERGSLFLLLINEISFDEFIKYRVDVIEIVRSFQQWTASKYPNTETIHDIGASDHANIFKVLSWISDEDVSNGLKVYFQEGKPLSYRAKADLALIKNNNVAFLYRKFIGKVEYKNLIESLLNMVIKNQEIDNLNQLASVHFMEVDSCLGAIKKKFEVHARFGESLPTFYQSIAAISESDISKSLKKALDESCGWHEYLSSEAWSKYPYSLEICRYFYSLMLTSILLELVHEENVPRNIQYLSELCEHEISLRSGLSSISSEFYSGLVHRINTDNLSDFYRSELLLILEIIFELREVMDDEEAEAEHFV